MNSIWIRRLRLFTAASLLTFAAPGGAAENMCKAPQELDKYQLLRRLSLDLRGQVPSFEEYEALDTQQDVPASVIQAYLQSEPFRVAMRRYHESMFWPNVTNVRLHGQGPQLSLITNEAAARSPSTGRAQIYRGVPDGNCGDFEQTQFDPAFPGEFRPDPAAIKTIDVNGKPAKQEGYRLVEPYWAPGTSIKVCAFDAQETAQTAKSPQGCGTVAGNQDPACGCGPKLKWCFPGGGVDGANSVDRNILESFREQLGRAVDAVTVGGKPYTDLLLSTKSWQNGAIASYKRDLSKIYQTNLAILIPDQDEKIADLAYSDAQWVEVDRKGLHAGVLTSPAYLLRFQTDRSRANRFRINFLCEHFVPPTVLSSQPGCVADSNDLTQKCMCQYCHSTLEPLAMRWGLFVEAGTTLMTDTQLFPRTNPKCVGSGSGLCDRLYVTQKDAHNAGSLMPFQWADLHPEYVRAMDEGPRVLAQSAVNDGSFARCTTRKLFGYLMQRELEADGGGPEIALLNQLADGFKNSDYNFSWLVAELVKRSEYRRAR